MKKIMVSLAALALLAVVVPQAEAGQRRHGHNRGGHAISSGHGHHRAVIRHGHRRAHHNGYYGQRRYYRPYYGNPYYSPYYGGYYGGNSPYYYGFPGIALSFGGDHHHGGHHGGGHHGGGHH